MTRGANVKVFNNLPKGMRAPSRESAGARVRLKLYALAYVEARHGVDASPALCWDALVLYCQAALLYVAALEGNRDPNSILIDRTIQDDRGPSGARTMTPGGDRVAQARTELKLAAMGYEATRRGTDSYTQGGHAAIAMVCQAAIRYAEALEGAGADKSHLYNHLGIED